MFGGIRGGIMTIIVLLEVFFEVWSYCMDDDFIYIYHVHHSLHLMTIVSLVVRESSVGLV